MLVALDQPLETVLVLQASDDNGLMLSVCVLGRLVVVEVWKHFFCKSPPSPPPSLGVTNYLIVRWN